MITANPFNMHMQEQSWNILGTNGTQAATGNPFTKLKKQRKGKNPKPGAQAATGIIYVHRLVSLNACVNWHSDLGIRGQYVNAVAERGMSL
jgi:hypothetical protein